MRKLGFRPPNSSYSSRALYGDEALEGPQIGVGVAWSLGASPGGVEMSGGGREQEEVGSGVIYVALPPEE